MKIATYNVWNEDKNFKERKKQLIREIVCVNADIIALQEVTPRFYTENLKSLAEYPYCEYEQYTGEEEGLAILSKYPITGCTFLYTEKYGKSNALNVLIRDGQSCFSFTDIHLPWDSVLAKESQIVIVDEFMHEQKALADYFILLGDFNCDVDSSIHRFLVGSQTLCRKEANPSWLEISSTFAELHDKTLLPTLDCISNPRWKGKNSIYAPENCDRIYIMDNWNPFSFEDVKLFGTEVDPVSKLCASDHYGVMAEVGFPQ